MLNENAVSVLRDGAEVLHDNALNDAVVTKGAVARVIQMDINCDGIEAISFSGDGVIVCTPTGSTAYNLSVGGPILDPSVASWVMSPIAAHSLAVRPLVINDSSVVEAIVELRSPTFRFTVDGKSLALPSGSRLRVSRAPFPLNVVTLPGHTFTDTLRTKLGLGC